MRNYWTNYWHSCATKTRSSGKFHQQDDFLKVFCLHRLVFYLPHSGLCLCSTINLLCRTIYLKRDIYRSLHNAVQFCTSHVELQNCISLGLEYFKCSSVFATYGQLSKWSSLGNILLLYSIWFLKIKFKLLCCSTLLAPKVQEFSPCRSLIWAAKTVMLKGCSCHLSNESSSECNFSFSFFLNQEHYISKDLFLRQKSRCPVQVPLSGIRFFPFLSSYHVKNEKEDCDWFWTPSERDINKLGNIQWRVIKVIRQLWNTTGEMRLIKFVCLTWRREHWRGRWGSNCCLAQPTEKMEPDSFQRTVVKG